ncbi:MAG: class I SAM-dependent methyltransferase [Cyclobacteriaceae bacterium]|jgi:SAM-dependent methyltransferase|nr:class I SAM-dependent methyltransferase [Cyclobacteriaceae bacterium]
MAKIYTTEITSEQLVSDNPIHQRLFKAYVVAQEYVQGDVLEVGCGEGRGVELLMAKAASFTAVDKIDDALSKLRQRYPSAVFIAMDLPPLHNLPDNAYDCVVSFQVIEHIPDDRFYLEEIHRVLKPGGLALITTPNRKQSLSRNPWHIREYLADELDHLAAGIFNHVEMKGITGNEKVMAYHEKNRKSVQRIMRWDILNLQHRLPAWMLRWPYEMLNRLNRNKLQRQDDTLVSGIHHSDYLVTDRADEALDLFLIARK